MLAAAVAATATEGPGTAAGVEEMVEGGPGGGVEGTAQEEKEGKGRKCRRGHPSCLWLPFFLTGCSARLAGFCIVDDTPLQASLPRTREPKEGNTPCVKRA